MKRFSLASAAVAASTFFAALAAADDLDPIVIKGSKFFYQTNGTQFFMKGVAYQADTSSDDSSASFIDPLADATACARDVPVLQALGTNVIRVYAINVTEDHSDCMRLLNDAGIYVVSDLSEPSESINRDSPTWNQELYERYTGVVDAMAGYSNVLGFFAGNEVSNNATNTNASPFVKAAVRDMKAYIRERGYRSIPVGYATNDDAGIRNQLANYFNCGDSDDSIDFWGYNIYSWCGDSSYTESGYSDRTEEFANYSVPVFFAEYGCNEVQPREFTEVEAIYGDDMAEVWSGGIVYMYFEEANNYGLVTVDSSSSVSLLADYTYLSSQLATATPTGVVSSAYTPTNTEARACPTQDSNWMAATNLPPTPNSELCSCMVSALSCVAGSSISDSDISDLFSYICGSGVDCSGINANGTSGVYGAYSMCSASERLSWAMNAYYLAQDSSSDACDFSGSATTQATSATASACSSLMSEAGGISGTGTVTSQPTVASGSVVTASNAAGAITVPSVYVGILNIGAAMLVAILGGAALVLV